MQPPDASFRALSWPDSPESGGGLAESPAIIEAPGLAETCRLSFLGIPPNIGEKGNATDVRLEVSYKNLRSLLQSFGRKSNNLERICLTMHKRLTQAIDRKGELRT